MSDFKLDHPNFEWEGRQTCVMYLEELLGKINQHLQMLLKIKKSTAGM